MTRLVICEKPSQARNVLAAIGNEHGAVLAARGHLIRLAEPHEVNPDWKGWNYDLLRPPSGFYPLREDRTNGKGENLDRIKEALKTATTVIIATDCDREGQAIGENILRYFKYKGEVLRAIFSAEDPDTLKSAFENLEPNSKYQSLYSAAVARAQADQIANLTATRAVTCALRPNGMKGAIGVGRVKTPTMAIVCRREQNITDFQPRDYYNLVLNISDGNETVALTYAPTAENRIFDRERAEEIVSKVAAWEGPVLITREARKKTPPKLLDLPTLQQRAATWGWSVTKALDVAQSLYETYKITTYPRSENKYLPESEAVHAQALLSAIASVKLFPCPFDDPIIRRGKAGHFSDKGLAGSSHHAIIPNVRAVDRFAAIVDGLPDDERKLFDLIAKSYIAALAPDSLFDYTSFSVVAAGHNFVAKGRIETLKGWKAIYTDHSDDDDDDDADSENGVAFPSWENEQIVSVGGIEPTASIITATTTAPSRYTEGTLIAAMQGAWRFASDPDTIARLKETAGIGTPATRAGVIEGLKNQGLIVVTKNKLHATNIAMQIFEILNTNAPELLDPTRTAEMEAQLNAILTGDANPRSVIDTISEQTRDLAVKMQGLAAQGTAITGITIEPSPAMLKAARDKAKRAGKRLPKGAAQDREICSAFLGPRSSNSSKPSEKQLAYATKIAAKACVTLPATALADSRILSKWLDANKPKKKRK